ncbi:hypothetical protein N665_0114s0054 [Sinapis alba]|nr:hypothetical protein N665_0114s0054 [Sinapis alba]
MYSYKTLKKTKRKTEEAGNEDIMKLLSWIRTIKQNGLLDQLKEFKGNFSCLRAQASSEVQDIRTNSFSFYGPSHDHPKLPEADEELLFDDEDVFSGFLTIGTLGGDPETPRFTSVAEEHVTGAEKDLAKLITEKSNAEEDLESDDVRPSQGNDLYQSPIEFTKRSKEVKKKKALLTSLLKKRKTVERECNSMEKHGTPYMIKRVLEKLHRSSSKTRNDGDDDVSKKKDLRKNVQIFRSKVHPVLCTRARDDKEIDDRRSKLKDPPLDGGFLVSSSILEVNMKREKWIKTDAEYLVLEF